MRVNDAIASPAPKSPKPSTVGGAGTMRDTRANADVVREAGDERALADFCATRARGRHRALPARDSRPRGGGPPRRRRGRRREHGCEAARHRGGGRGGDGEGFRTAEALLLTPSPGSKRFGTESRAGAVAGARAAGGRFSSMK